MKILTAFLASVLSFGAFASDDKKDVEVPVEPAAEVEESADAAPSMLTRGWIYIENMYYDIFARPKDGASDEAIPEIVVVASSDDVSEKEVEVDQATEK